MRQDKNKSGEDMMCDGHWQEINAEKFYNEEAAIKLAKEKIICKSCSHLNKSRYGYWCKNSRHNFECENSLLHIRNIGNFGCIHWEQKK